MFYIKCVISWSAFSMSVSRDLRLFLYIIFYCLRALISFLSLSMSPMVSLYLLSFCNKLENYNVDLFLKISHFSEHDFDFSILALFFEFSDILLELLDLHFQIGLGCLQSKQISSLPFILFSVMIGLFLHFLNDVKSWPFRGNWEWLWVFASWHQL